MQLKSLISTLLAAGALVAAALAPAGAATHGVGETHLTLTQDTATRGDPSGQMRVAVWYPADPATPMKPIAVGPPANPFFSEGSSAPNVPLAAQPAPFPLIVISHANGSIGMQLSWLGSALAAAGYVAAAVDHPGDNFTSGATVQGTTLTWLRATDLTRAIDGILADPRFAWRIDPDRIGAAGFSFGGNTVLVAAGARVDLTAFAAYCTRNPRAPACTGAGLPELPNFREREAQLVKTDAAFRASLAQAGASYREPRIRAVLSIAPAFSPEFTQASLRAIGIPVAIVGGFDDPITPVADNMIPDATLIPNAELYIFERPAAHFTFLDQCTAVGSKQFAGSCADSGPLRTSVHARTIDLAVDFFARSLAAKR